MRNVWTGWKAHHFLGYDPEVELPDLPPNLSFPRLRNTAPDVDFAYQAKCSALGPHIKSRWGWDEAFQRKVHEQRYSDKPFFAIQRADQRLGTISIDIFDTYVQLGEFYLLPALQGRGIGSAILQHFLSLADRYELRVKLEYLHWNPVGRLYRRFGFVEMARSEKHCFMERPPTS